MGTYLKGQDVDHFSKDDQNTENSQGNLDRPQFIFATSCQGFQPQISAIENYLC